MKFFNIFKILYLFFTKKRNLVHLMKLNVLYVLKVFFRKNIDTCLKIEEDDKSIKKLIKEMNINCYFEEKKQNEFRI